MQDMAMCAVKRHRETFALEDLAAIGALENRRARLTA